MRLDGDTISYLYRTKVLDERLLLHINILNSLEAGVRPAIIADRYKVSKQLVYKIKRKVPKS